MGDADGASGGATGETEGDCDGERNDGATDGPVDGDDEGDRTDGAAVASSDGAREGDMDGLPDGAKVASRMHAGARPRNWCRPSGRITGLQDTKSEHCFRAPCHWKPSQFVTFMHAAPQNSLILLIFGSTSITE
jgi:hypothetical protein